MYIVHTFGDNSYVNLVTHIEYTINIIHNKFGYTHRIYNIHYTQ